MTARLGRGWMIGGVAVLLAAVLLWAWHNGGERPLSQLTAPAMLPKVGA